eukprot:1396593-Prymnesium_polylepis.1
MSRSDVENSTRLTKKNSRCRGSYWWLGHLQLLKPTPGSEGKWSCDLSDFFSALLRPARGKKRIRPGSVQAHCLSSTDGWRARGGERMAAVR